MEEYKEIYKMYCLGMRCGKCVFEKGCEVDYCIDYSDANRPYKEAVNYIYRKDKKGLIGQLKKNIGDNNLEHYLSMLGKIKFI